MKLLLLCVALFGAVAYADDWAVLVAGSNTYGNYRHQSDVAHSYQIMKAHGIPDDHIITFLYDDIADSYQNPFKGQVFNAPTAAGTPGVDVWSNIKKDYTGKDVTPDNFVACLTGDSSKASGPVLQSTSSDNVFIYFADHGGTGLIAFPSKYLYAKDLNAALQTMHDKNMYSKLVFYMEACESGSMFDGLLASDMNIYATTAANPYESSWGWYCPPEDQVDGKSIGSCLGDEYSIIWLEDTDSTGVKQSLGDQFATILSTVSKSHPQQYGDMSFNDDKLQDFFGGVAAWRKNHAEKVERPSSAVRSPDIPLHLAYYEYLRAEGFEARLEKAQNLQSMLSHQIETDVMFSTVAKHIAGENAALILAAPAPAVGEVSECLFDVYDKFEAKCGGFSDYSLKYSKVFANLCAESSAEAINAVLDRVCA